MCAVTKENHEKPLSGSAASRFDTVLSDSEAIDHAVATFGEISNERMNYVNNVGLFQYESEPSFQGLAFKAGDVIIGEGTGSTGHSASYMLRRHALLFYFSLAAVMELAG